MISEIEDSDIFYNKEGEIEDDKGKSFVGEMLEEFRVRSEAGGEVKPLGAPETGMVVMVTSK